MNNDQIPLEFLNFSIPQYPSLNTKKNFEAYFFEYFQNQEFNTSLKYIPIQWTNYLVKQNYGRDIQDLNNYLKLNLKSEEKYFTIVQYSGGPLIELENTLIFSMGGTINTKLGKNSKVIPLPLLYDSNLKKADLEKKYIASYIGRPTHKIRMKLEEWNKVINLNLTSTFLISKNVIKKMLKNKNGKIINVTSVVGHTGNIGQANYAASKAGLIGMSKSLALEYGKKNIKINCISPGFIKSEMTEKINDNFKQTLLDKISLERFGIPEDVANAALFLSSDLSNYITGETIHVNGGMYFS